MGWCRCQLSSRLSKKKLKTLSVGGRLTLVKSVLSSLPLYYYYMSSFKMPISVLKKWSQSVWIFLMVRITGEKKLSLISWKRVLSSKKNGGLGLSSFFAMNRALLFKWVWRFIVNGSSLWSRFIRAIHGGLDNHLPFSKCTPWTDIVSEVRKLLIKALISFRLLKRT